jgi:hypothetical protein
VHLSIRAVFASVKHRAALEKQALLDLSAIERYTDEQSNLASFGQLGCRHFWRRRNRAASLGAANRPRHNQDIHTDECLKIGMPIAR